MAHGWIKRRSFRCVALLSVLSLASGCTVNGPGPLASSQGFGPTVSFESVDGPPQQVFDRMVRALEAESASRSFTIVSRNAPASYRIRSYLSAQVQRRGGTTIAWVWDVYDRDQQRALRLSGVEDAGKATRDAWAAADDQVLRRISQAGLRGLSTLIDGTSPSQDQPPAQAPGRTGPAVASAGDEAPASGNGALAFNAH